MQPCLFPEHIARETNALRKSVKFLYTKKYKIQIDFPKRKKFEGKLWTCFESLKATMQTL